MESDSDNKKWVEHWTRVGPILEKIRDEELRAMTDSQAASECISLFEFATDQQYHEGHASGLVEQQRFFLRLRDP